MVAQMSLWLVCRTGCCCELIPTTATSTETTPVKKSKINNHGVPARQQPTLQSWLQMAMMGYNLRLFACCMYWRDAHAGCVSYCWFCCLCLRVFGGFGSHRDNSHTTTIASIMVKNGHDRLQSTLICLLHVVVGQPCGLCFLCLLLLLLFACFWWVRRPSG